MAEHGVVTALLKRIAQGDTAAEELLIPHIYDELRRIASRHLAKEHHASTLQPTALVHEAYLRLSRDALSSYENRNHFFAIASRVMRRILIDHARRRGSAKRGATIVHLPLEEGLQVAGDTDELVLAVHAALERLEALDARQARIIEMRFFAGLEVAEIADILKLSVRTVHREWTTARAWLYGELRGQ
jgi:RNA polymerase sigma-70 factor, ECF subfamily